MPGFVFQTISDELVECATIGCTHFDSRGFRVQEEPSELGFPSTPAFVAKRQKSTTIALVVRKIDRVATSDWVGYCKTSSGDTRLALLFDSPTAPSSDDERWLRQLGVGLFVLENDQMAEKTPTTDLAVAIFLPALSELPRKVRELIGPAYDKITAGNWHDAFEDACRVLEIESRKHLVRGSRAGRLKFVTPQGKSYAPTASQIDKMTMGRLATVFSEIVARNKPDEIIGQTLFLINEDRIGVVHHRDKSRVERRLRKKAGKHFWTIINALKVICK